MRPDYMLCGVAVLVGLACAALSHDEVTPALIGHGCIGAGGDLWAMDESDFPTKCRSIEKWDWGHRTAR